MIQQCDDQLGRLLDYLEKSERMQDTMIVLTSDHGDYLGDHWLGEKDLFHEPSVKVPLIVYDPRTDADATRGSTCDALIESIDLAPTFVEVAGAKIPDHILEGKSLLPHLRAGAQPKHVTMSSASTITRQHHSAPSSDLNHATLDCSWCLMGATS